MTSSLERFSVRRTLGVLLAAGGLALVLLLGTTSVASAQDDQTDYTPTTPTTVPDETTTTPPPVSVERIRQSQDDGDTLPVTGSDIMGLTLLGLGVLAVGGGLIWYSRRAQATDAS